MFMQLNNKKRSGFTLIEIVIVVAVVGLLASATVVNMGKNSDRDVKQEADRLATFLRSVQGMALSGEQASEADVGSTCWDSSVTPHKYKCKVCGYGIEMDGANIKVYFATRSSEDDSCTDFIHLTDVDYTNRVFYPQKNVAISDLDSDKILFLMPNGKIYKNSVPISTDITISLSKTEGSTVTVPITITPNGIIGY